MDYWLQRYFAVRSRFVELVAAFGLSAGVIANAQRVARLAYSRALAAGAPGEQLRGIDSVLREAVELEQDHAALSAKLNEAVGRVNAADDELREAGFDPRSDTGLGFVPLIPVAVIAAAIAAVAVVAGLVWIHINRTRELRTKLSAVAEGVVSVEELNSLELAAGGGGSTADDLSSVVRAIPVIVLAGAAVWLVRMWQR